ncbi:MAG: hypothetical protein O3A00_24750 [Planctomycetota bacterium]|nr:hypothetical protein [Planctomycetota bacterium]
MRKLVVTLGVVVGGLVSLFVVSGRAHQLIGYISASADTAADGVTEMLPDDVHDRKIDQEMKQVRLDLIDRQVQMNLSTRRIEELTAEVGKLKSSTERRQRLLAEAYPVLNSAVESRQTTVRWANQDFTLTAFQSEIDDLLAMQDRETHQLAIKQEGLDRLQQSVEEGERALAEMRRGLDETEQQVALLKSRREQAEIESETLDLVNSATANRESVAASLGNSISRLQDKVANTEARNEARRDLAPVALREGSNRIARGFNRLESLKAIHDSAAPVKPVSNETDSKPTTVPKPVAAKSDAAGSKHQKFQASKVTIEIRNKER